MWFQHYTLLIITLITLVHGMPRKKFHERKEIVYPDEIFVVKEKPRCTTNNTTTYCEQIDSYPTEFLRRGLQNKDYYHLFGEPNSELIDRSFYDMDGNELCPNRRITIYPKIAINTKKQWRYIYNFENYIQGIQIEVCVERDSCDLLGTAPIALMRRTKCKQKFMQRRLLSTSDEGQPIVDYFMLPSACSCTYINDYSFIWKLR